jgi:hypothetical protein
VADECEKQLSIGDLHIRYLIDYVSQKLHIIELLENITLKTIHIYRM